MHKKPVRKRAKDYTLRLNQVHKNFLVSQLHKEWQETERAEKRHEIVQRVRAGSIQFGKDLLTIMVIGGIATVVLVAPKIFVVVDAVRKYRRFFKNIDSKKVIKGYSSRGLIHYRKVDENMWQVEITNKGEKMLLKSEAERMKIKTTKQWDGIWRIVIFDIPRKHNVIRNTLRERLKKIGMYQLQESVFACPYPCEEEVGFWVSLYNASGFVRIIKANEVSGDKDLRSFFDLS